MPKVSVLSSIRAIIFDMNGVIVDDEPIHEKAFRQICQEALHVEITSGQYQIHCQGRTDEEGFEQILYTFHLVDFSPRELALQKMERYLQLSKNQLASFPGAVDFIKACHKRYRLALTSSSNTIEVKMVLKTFGIRNLFAVTVSADEVDHGKPDPEPYFITAIKLGENPKHCLVVEDSPNGVASAKAAGMYCIGLATTHTKQALSRADLVVNDFTELNSVFA